MSALTPEQRRAEALARASKLPPPRNALDIDAIERPLFELQGGGYDHEDAVDVLVEIWPEIDDSICGAIHHCADFIFRLQWFNNDDMPVAPIAYLIESLLPTQGTTLLPAPTGDGKTLMTMHLGMALLTGKPFFGLSVPEPASVLYLAGEGYEDIAPRFNALCERDGVDPASLSFAPRQVDSIDDIELSIRYIRRKIHKEERPQRLVVIIDTFSSVLRVKDENNSTEVRDYMFRLNGLVREYRCHIIGQTHTGKNPKSGTFGSIAWENHANTVLRLSCDAHDIRTLVVGKSRVTKRGRIIGHAAIEAAAINVPFIRELENGPAAGLDDTRAAPQSERSARPGQVSVSRSNKGGRAKPLRPATQADRDDARLHDALAPMALLDVIRLDDGSEAVPWRNVHDAFIDGLDGSQDRGNQSRRWKEALLRAGIEPQPVQHDGKRFLKLPAARL